MDNMKYANLIFRKKFQFALSFVLDSFYFQNGRSRIETNENSSEISTNMNLWKEN